MHFNTNPFAPVPSTPRNIFMHDNPLKLIRHSIDNDDRLVSTLPKDFTFVELNLNDEADFAAFHTFINAHFYSSSDDNYRIMFDTSTILALRDIHARVFAIRYKSTIVATQVIEMMDLSVHDITFMSAYANFYVIHPKFRKRFMGNVFMFLVFAKIVEDGALTEFWMSNAKIGTQPFTSKMTYVVPLTPTGVKAIGGIIPSVGDESGKVELRKMTMEDAKVFQRRRYAIQQMYDEVRLAAMVKYDQCFTDGNGRYVAFTLYWYVLGDGTKVRNAYMIDWVDEKGEYGEMRTFMKAVMRRLRDGEGVDMVTVMRGCHDDMTMAFGFKKGTTMWYYMMNMLPSAKPDEVALNLM